MSKKKLKLPEMESQAKPACKDLTIQIQRFGFIHTLIEANPERNQIYPANYMGYSGFVLKRVEKIKMSFQL